MIRIGHAWDTHRLVPDRKLILGGVEINSPVGLLGHSDADVCLHALSEALLGSLALGDLGEHFSDKDPLNKDKDSKEILKYCYDLVIKKGYRLSNVDITIYSESIKISPTREKIRENIAKMLSTNIDNVSVKATTWEKMGFIGRDEAIACEAVCLVKYVEKKILL